MTGTCHMLHVQWIAILTFYYIGRPRFDSENTKWKTYSDAMTRHLDFISSTNSSESIFRDYLPKSSVYSENNDNIALIGLCVSHPNSWWYYNMTFDILTECQQMLQCTGLYIAHWISSLTFGTLTVCQLDFTVLDYCTCQKVCLHMLSINCVLAIYIDADLWHLIGNSWLIINLVCNYEKSKHLILNYCVDFYSWSSYTTAIGWWHLQIKSKLIKGL